MYGLFKFSALLWAKQYHSLEAVMRAFSHTFGFFFVFVFFFLSLGIHTKMIGLRLPKTPLSLPFPKTSSVKAHFRPFQSTCQKSVRSFSKPDALGFLRENYEKWIKCPQKLLFVKPTNKEYIYYST